MKRFHIHLLVQDLEASIRFYNNLFDSLPARIESDYAKWMLEDPRINFAISTRGDKQGIDHLGFQADSVIELSELMTRAKNADIASVVDEGSTSCCYARSDKHWVTDPQGIAWEQFHTLSSIPMFNESTVALPVVNKLAQCDTSAAVPGTKACCG